MQFRTMKFADLIPADYNPRKALKPGDREYEKLRRSLEEFGCVDPLVWNLRTGRIVGGHQRLTVMLDLGWTEGDVSVVDLPEEKEKALNIALNKISGEWDMDRLRELLVDLEASDLDVTLTGFDTEELADIMPKDQDREPEEDGFDGEAEAAKIVDPVTRPGDLYLLGDHRLLCGETEDTRAMQYLMDGRLADLVWTDPPYNVDYHNDKGEGLENDNLPPEVFQKMIDSAFQNLYLYTRQGGCFYVSHSDVGGLTFRSALVASGFIMKQCLIWVKSGAVLGRQDYNWKHEPILYGWKPGRAHYFCMDYTLTTVIDEDVDVSKMKREDLVALVKELRKCQATTVIREDRPSRNALHPTQKPIPLVGRMIRNSTPNRQGVLILDGFGGSGTTLMSCEQMGRECFTMEKDPVYCDVIVKRWEQFTGRKVCLISAGVGEGAAVQAEDLGGVVPVQPPG
ncbi:MAG: site-specific DNA-methyltransferase [Syntrophales bacterium]|nr:site-specific DNA-methyltransferase [Syntrophales bacterium]